MIATRQRRPISAQFLSEHERITISDLRRTGATVRAIATALWVAARRRARRVDRDGALRAHVQQLLALRWSPEQISRALSVKYADDPARQLVTESIYQAI